MNSFLGALRLLAIVVWVGGLAFFAFILAPVAFHVLPSTHEAGLVVAGTLRVFSQVAPVCGAVFVVATMVLWFRIGSVPHRSLAMEAILVVLMLVGTTYIQLDIIPAMERDRVAAGGVIDAVDKNNPARVDFERLHGLSEKTEGGVLLLGLGVVLLMAAEPDGSARSEILESLETIDS